jgi:hypothetical protein
VALAVAAEVRSCTLQGADLGDLRLIDASHADMRALFRMFVV